MKNKKRLKNFDRNQDYYCTDQKKAQIMIKTKSQKALEYSSK